MKLWGRSRKLSFFRQNRRDLPVLVVMLLFIVLNALKIALFNYYITNSKGSGVFLYKYAFTVFLMDVLYFFTLKLKSRIPFILIYILQGAYIFANIAYYFYFHSYLHIFQSLALMTEGLDAAGHLSIPWNYKLFVVFIDLPVFIYLISIYRRVCSSDGDTGKVARLFVVLSALLLFLLEGWNYVHGYSLIHFIKGQTVGESVIVERYGTIANNIAGISASGNDKKLIRGLKPGKLIKSGGSSQRPNIVVIQVESLEAGVVNREYKGKLVAPFLNSLSKASVYYPYVLSYHKAGGTSDCEFSTINSVEPLDNYPSMKIKSYNYSNSLVRKLVAGSYKTVAVHGNIASYFNRDTAYPRMGFMEFYDMNKMSLKNIGWGAPDSQMFDYAGDRLSKQVTPFFYYTITMTSHGPFTNARYYYNNRHYDSVKNVVVRDYLNSMSYVDGCLKDFITYIRTNFENTYIFIWGDHTPSIITDEYRQVSLNTDNRYFEFVPLIIVTPDGKVRREEREVASFLDIGPTILYTAGVDYTYRSDGINLLQKPRVAGGIPYKGKSYSREYLFGMIQKQAV